MELRPRKIGESLLRDGISIRDVVDFTEFWSTKYGTPKISRAAWHRHKQSGHFLLDDKPHISVDGEPILDLDEFVDKLWIDYQSANKGKIPEGPQLMKWLELRAKIRGDMERRREEKQMQAAIMSAAPEE